MVNRKALFLAFWVLAVSRVYGMEHEKQEGVQQNESSQWGYARALIRKRSNAFQRLHLLGTYTEQCGRGDLIEFSLNREAHKRYLYHKTPYTVKDFQQEVDNDLSSLFDSKEENIEDLVESIPHTLGNTSRKILEHDRGSNNDDQFKKHFLDKDELMCCNSFESSGEVCVNLAFLKAFNENHERARKLVSDALLELEAEKCSFQDANERFWLASMKVTAKLGCEQRAYRQFLLLFANKEEEETGYDIVAKALKWDVVEQLKILNMLEQEVCQTKKHCSSEWKKKTLLVVGVGILWGIIIGLKIGVYILNKKTVSQCAYSVKTGVINFALFVISLFGLLYIINLPARRCSLWRVKEEGKIDSKEILVFQRTCMDYLVRRLKEYKSKCRG